MKSRRGFTLIELLVVIAIIAILAAILFPVFARVRKTAYASNCQSNMKQIGSAMRMYLTDFDDTYPTNRDHNTGLIAEQCFITPYDPDNLSNRFEWGTTWVEGLYPYIERTGEATDAASVWRCQSTSNDTVLGSDEGVLPFMVVSYTFNGYLVEQAEGAVQRAAQTMMCRENDKLVSSMLRPWNENLATGVRATSGTTADIPQSPFAIGNDWMYGEIDEDIHNKGSNILFADAHVKHFKATSFVKDGEITGLKNWDPDSQQWWNLVPSQDGGGTIAITP